MSPRLDFLRSTGGAFIDFPVTSCDVALSLKRISALVDPFSALAKTLYLRPNPPAILVLAMVRKIPVTKAGAMFQRCL
jgi:hypothetical protein